MPTEKNIQNNIFMRTTLFTVILFLTSITVEAQDPARIRLTDTTLMHEMRATPYPQDKAVISDRSISFQWPLLVDLDTQDKTLKALIVQAARTRTDKNKLRYALRWSQDPGFKKGNTQVETRWPFFNPEKDLAPGVWHWQFGYIVDGKTYWASTQQVTIGKNARKFCPPALKTVLAGLPKAHPRVYMDKNDWDNLIRRSAGSADRKSFITRADKALATPMKTTKDINSKLAEKLTNPSQRQSMLTRESRRIIDNEEINVDVLIRAYLLTKDRRYSDEAMKRIKEMLSWSGDKNIVGDFNAATFVSLCATAYDTLYDLLDADTRKMLLDAIKVNGSKMFANFNNRLENHIADNHVWQMTFRIFTMAAFTVYGELPEADTWVDYCYNLWVARFPGLNKDGGWHNGDSYFIVNVRTLIEVPYFYSRISGFDFFSDPWYQGNAMYVIYQQPPFSKSAGNGSAHLNVTRPRGSRVGYADALARMTGNTYAASYVRTIQAGRADILTEDNVSKEAGLGWFRLQCNKPLPEGPGLKDMPFGYVFPETGLASFSTSLERLGRSSMISFRSSPYGSTSHALANQNAFNTFWSGQPLFYSSGHHISFIDSHSMFSHRATRAHNTILVNGIGQRIGTEGYGWIPRYYVGEKIGYILGDASNAYGKVISKNWLARARKEELTFSPEAGWDDVKLKTFRRHIVELGKTGFTFIYDELEAEEPVTWSYLLHTVTNPMNVGREKDFVHVQATSKNGVSDAYLLGSDELKTDTTSQFFTPAVNWLRADDKGNFKKYPNHWHFTATSGKHKVYRFVTIINTHVNKTTPDKPFAVPQRLKDGSIKMGSWIIKANVSSEGKPSFDVRFPRPQYDAAVTYDGEVTIVREDGYETTLRDKLPELEI